MKLTEAQYSVLQTLQSRNAYYSASYPPIKRLLAHGFIEQFQGRWAVSYRITEAGRSALAAARQGGGEP